jgi:purine-nucleoside phosphorylase
MTAGNRAEIEAAAAAIRSRWPIRPDVGLIAGSGLGEVTRALDVDVVLDLAAIPHFPRTTAPGHGNAMVCGRIARLPAVAFDGRFHGYEGHRAGQLAFPVRVMAALGVELLVLACAAGGLHPNYRAGDVMVFDDHVNLSWDNPLVGPLDTDSALGYPDMSCPYDPPLAARALAVARRHDIVARCGTYVGVLGPNYETRAEYRFLRRVGDAVGMSTVAEVIAAAQCGLRVLALAVITNVCSADRPRRADASQVIAAAQAASASVRTIVTGVLSDYETARFG